MSKKKPWSGRFSEKTSELVDNFTASLPFDIRLWQYDIQGSIAHARMLAKQGVISQDDGALIVDGLNRIREKILNGSIQFTNELEDVHMNIEAALIEEIGAVGGKLHTARSRNDQVNLDLRLYLRDEINEIVRLIERFQSTLADMAQCHIDVIMPGYTHLQRAQPVLLSHHLLAYWEMLNRDKSRFLDCLNRLNSLPLGACALAGTTIPIDRGFVAEALNFSEISHNSMDTVSDRDFALEFLSNASIVMAHLSRFSEDIILWCSGEFGFVTLPDAFATGSSIMPQKKNPDVLELVRGKTGRVYGDMMSLFTTLKGLPLCYNRDLQEDKEPIFDAVDTVKACLEVMTAMLPELTFHPKIMARAAEGGFSTATDLAEYLVKKGAPFREAHEITGKIVRFCIEQGKTALELTLEEFKRFSERIEQDVYSMVELQASINNKISYGSTGRERVLQRIEQIKTAS